MNVGLMSACLLVFPGALGAQTSSFVVRLGNDTLSVERYTRTATEIKGEQVIRVPRAAHRLYTITLAPDGSVQRFELVTHNITGEPGPAETRATAEWQGDSVVTRTPGRDSVVTRRIGGVKGAPPYVLHVYGLMEQIGRQARAAASDSFSIPAVTLGQAQPWVMTVRRLPGDTIWVRFSNGLGPFKFTLDAGGNLTGLTGKGSTVQVEVQKVASFDMAAMGPAFAARPLGALSARDTARATVGGAELWVDYSRPQKRGRVIFGDVVPWDGVWRTGANSATQFHTSADLVIGGTTIPAGTYTLWTIPSRSGWKLIINKQTGQWGTEYHVEQDLARVDAPATTLGAPLEQLTIRLDPKDASSGALVIAWDTQQLTIPFTKK
jgi:hypothetical protein